MICQLCNTETDCKSTVVGGKYYSRVCSSCLSGLRGDSSVSSGFQSFDRRRQYEDLAQDTVQPYNASGPNSEFYRLYPAQAQKIFTAGEIEEVKRQL